MRKFKMLIFLFLRNPLAGVIAGLQAVKKKSFLDYRFFKNGWSFYPSTIVFHPTARCNLSCKMCVVNSYDLSKELSLMEIKNIINQIAFFKPHFYIAGGEPLLRKDLEKIIAYAKRRGLVTTLTTNGILLTEERAQRLVKAGIDGVSVSIDGPKKINDKIRGKGNFEKAVKAIDFLNEIKRKNNLLFPKLKIATVISGFSYSHLSKMVKLAEELKVEEIIFFHLDYKSQQKAKAHKEYMLANFNQPTGCLGYVVKDKPSEEEKKFIAIKTEVLKKQMGKIFSDQHQVSVSFAPPVPRDKINDYYNGQYFQDFFCTNPWFSATVLPNGDLVPCFSLKTGNLRENSFRELWNNSFYRKFRQCLKANKHFSGCFRCCGTTDIS